MKKTTFSNCKTRQQIANEFGFSYQTLWRKLKKRNIEIPTGLICPNSLFIIYEALGYPNGISRSDFQKPQE